MLRIDPHTHTTCSDGTLSAAQLLEAAAQAHLDVIGITDHDTFAHYDAVQEAYSQAPEHTQSLQVILGVEVSCELPGGIGCHILAYLCPPDGQHLAPLLQRSRDSRWSALKMMVQKLASDFAITWDSVAALVPGNGTPGRPHVADALVNAGAFPNRSAAFDHVLSRGGRYYVPRWAPTPLEAIEAIKADGGVPILAHPFAPMRGRVLSAQDVKTMAEAGLAGIEVYHRDLDAQGQALALRLAQENGLLVSGASDYHGEGKPNLLGENLMPEETYLAVCRRGAYPVLGQDRLL
ncbi:MAG: PHP domain-containing protein [Actinomycetaceae bacterium]|nr:PHP domain-containing protein [Actinomycetaceae bacterium]